MRNGEEEALLEYFARFLMRLTSSSFGFSNIRVDSRQWQVADGISDIGLHPSPFTDLVVDVRKEDFDSLYLEDIKQFGDSIPALSFGLTLPV